MTSPAPSAAVQDNVMDFSFEKIAPHTYKVQLKNLRAGEYGFLAPGTTTTSLGHGCNSDVAMGTSLTFTGGPLTTGEGIYVNNNDLTLTAPSSADASTS
jgi:hypothetical protein